MVYIRRRRLRARLQALGATALLPAGVFALSLLAHAPSRAVASDTTLPTVPDCVDITINVTQPPITAYFCP
ncbi:MAG: hypothetical protein M3394_10320 [Actinomycetota bacterium]|nr:hypothetical protein [Actinomycetota bacterium]